MAVPKRKISKSRRDKKRAPNIKITAPNIIECPQCHEPNVSHRVCASCGFYDGKEVISVD